MFFVKKLCAALAALSIAWLGGCAHLSPIELKAGGITLVRVETPRPLRELVDASVKSAHVIALTNPTDHHCLIDVYDKTIGWIGPHETVYDEWGFVAGYRRDVPVVFRCFRERFVGTDNVPFSNFVEAFGGVVSVDARYRRVASFPSNAKGAVGPPRKAKIPQRGSGGDTWLQFVNASPHPVSVNGISNLRKTTSVTIAPMASYAVSVRGDGYSYYSRAEAVFTATGLSGPITVRGQYDERFVAAMQPVIVRR